MNSICEAAYKKIYLLSPSLFGKDNIVCVEKIVNIHKKLL